MEQSSPSDAERNSGLTVASFCPAAPLSFSTVLKETWNTAETILPSFDGRGWKQRGRGVDGDKEWQGYMYSMASVIHNFVTSPLDYSNVINQPGHEAFRA
ncbi:hypothetical protein KIL84_001146 [Mauremys mutica]|uniref:Uncharacterized protein n=1 Tax=Mauremys mutica TaxID=74926 RepID=A0A9D4AVG5_9SAUR|nr:hypothetical protein KIL84_001146 [Mauremys mutica]